MNRVGASKIALEAAKKISYGGVLASDGFFPFADTVELADVCMPVTVTVVPLILIVGVLNCEFMGGVLTNITAVCNVIPDGKPVKLFVTD